MNGLVTNSPTANDAKNVLTFSSHDERAYSSVDD